MVGSKTDAKKYRSLLQVRIPKGRRFPLDMLRYDRCHPYEEVDAHTIEKTMEYGVFVDKDLHVFVEKYHVDADPRWGTARWLAYGVDVQAATYEDVAARRTALAK